MALTPFTPQRLADVQNAAALTENWGRPTAYFQRYLQTLLSNLNGTFGDLAAIIAEIDAIIIELADQQNQINAAVADLQDLTLVVADAISVFGNSIDAITNSWKYNYSSVSPVSGYVNLAHGLGANPGLNRCMAQLASTTSFALVTLIAVDAFNLTIYLQDNTGAPISGGSYGITWWVLPALPPYPP